MHAGEMRNSNSIIAWLIVSAEFNAAEVPPPARGRAPEWRAGIVVASRAGQLSSAVRDTSQRLGEIRPPRTDWAERPLDDMPLGTGRFLRG